MIEFILAVTFTSVFLIFLALVGGSERIAVQERLKAMQDPMAIVDSDELMLKPLHDRVIRPFLEKIALLVRRISPAGIGKETQQKLDLAGHPWHLQVNEYLGLRGLTPAVFLIGSLVLFSILKSPAIYRIPCVILALIIGILLPEALLQHIISDRQTKIRKSLPDTIDMLIVSVEAGTGFDGAISKVVAKTRGPLSEEFDRALKEMRFGSSRKDALREMARRTGVQEISTFVAAIYQADQLGVSIAQVLRVQGSEMRKLRSRKARELGAKLPVKMLIPLILFVFPATLVVIAGPAILAISRMFATWGTRQ